MKTYADTKYRYVRQVDVHSHWIGLAMLMIVLGAVFDSVALSGRMQLVISLALLAGSVAFPLGVMLQTLTHGGNAGERLRDRRFGIGNWVSCAHHFRVCAIDNLSCGNSDIV